MYITIQNTNWQKQFTSYNFKLQKDGLEKEYLRQVKQLISWISGNAAPLFPVCQCPPTVKLFHRRAASLLQAGGRRSLNPPFPFRISQRSTCSLLSASLPLSLSFSPPSIGFAIYANFLRLPGQRSCGCHSSVIVQESPGNVYYTVCSPPTSSRMYARNVVLAGRLW